MPSDAIQELLCGVLQFFRVKKFLHRGEKSVLWKPQAGLKQESKQLVAMPKCLLFAEPVRVNRELTYRIFLI